MLPVSWHARRECYKNCAIVCVLEEKFPKICYKGSHKVLCWGLFFFSVYINDLPSCTNTFNMIMYADDTTLFCDINGNPADEHVLNTELCKITDWLYANKLSLNVNKTKCMVFHSHKKKYYIQNYSLMLSKSSVLIALIFLVCN